MTDVPDPKRMDVLLPRARRESRLTVGSILAFAAIVIAIVGIAGVARSQILGAGPESWISVLWKWSPLLLGGFAFNIAISIVAMTIGTILGAGLGIGLLSEVTAIRKTSWCVMQIFRNSPWLVLLFFAMFLVPFQIKIGDFIIPLPGWIKACVGFSLPVMANVAEIVRGAVKSLPGTQWEAAESLAFTRRQTMWMIILPQCFRRMLPPWMNLYSLITMATVLASVVGVSEMLTLTSDVHAAEGGRPELFAPLYGFALVCFFVYCYPIGRLTIYLERRLHV
ncbi:MAG TPA: amino acid ABC transporter permease [Aurantimonas coralicida]|uniref:Amino acid ABC transporter permease n=2 Tax=root TaxID=1 RepID=A0A9C9TGN3_9HYPH|nr:amino acid ABC transporter permease [Aurantimonas coralicida]HEU00422.1 amino acid ABC transporter permease [Aurantimonas coralicida]